MTIHSIETLNPCEQRISVTIDSKAVNKAIQAKVRKKATTINYGGFRPNTLAAHQLAAKKITPQEEAEIHKKLCTDSFFDICSQQKIDYEGRPILQDFKSNPDGSLSYVALVEIYPSIPHVNWERVTLKKLETQITDQALREALPLFKKMGFEKIMADKATGIQYCEWMVVVFHYQQLRDQVMQALAQHNKVNDLPPRVTEARYQALKQDHKTETFNEDKLRQQAREYIAADILFKAYALEHNIKPKPEMLATRIEEAKHNPFIMGHVKDLSLLPHYTALRLFEETIINHLVDNADCQTTILSLHDFMQLSFNKPGVDLSRASTPQEEENTTPTQPILQEESTK